MKVVGKIFCWVAVYCLLLVVLNSLLELASSYYWKYTLEKEERIFSVKKTLFTAIEAKDIKTINALVKRYPELLHLVIIFCKDDVDLRCVITKKTVDVRDNWGRTPLHLAAFLGRINFAMRLIENGADPKTVDNGGTSCLEWAGLGWRGKERKEIIKILRL